MQLSTSQSLSLCGFCIYACYELHLFSVLPAVQRISVLFWNVHLVKLAKATHWYLKHYYVILEKVLLRSQWGAQPAGMHTVCPSKGADKPVPEDRLVWIPQFLYIVAFCQWQTKARICILFTEVVSWKTKEIKEKIKTIIIIFFRKLLKGTILLNFAIFSF